MIYIAYTVTDPNRASQHEAGINCRNFLFLAAGINTDFAKNEKGRPYAVSGEADFSVTHSNRLAACALVTDKTVTLPKQWDNLSNQAGIKIISYPHNGSRIGLDAEYVDPRADTGRLCRVYERFFSSPVSSADEFYTLWTKREAFGKLHGDGVLCKQTDTDCRYESFTLKLGIDDYRICICFK